MQPFITINMSDDDAWSMLPATRKNINMSDLMSKNKSDMKEAFTATKESLDAKSERLIEALRTTVLNANSHGEFLELGISPAVLTDDFVMRVKTFVELQSKENENVIVGYWMKQASRYSEGWLLAVLSGRHAFETSPHTLAIVRVSGKNADNQFFETLLDDVVSVLQDFFPVIRREDNGTANNKENVCRSGMELKEALLKAKSLRESGQYKPLLDHNAIQEADKSVPIQEKTVEVQVAVAQPVVYYLPPHVIKALLVALVVFVLLWIWCK